MGGRAALDTRAGLLLGMRDGRLPFARPISGPRLKTPFLLQQLHGFGCWQPAVCPRSRCLLQRRLFRLTGAVLWLPFADQSVAVLHRTAQAARVHGVRCTSSGGGGLLTAAPQPLSSTKLGEGIPRDVANRIVRRHQDRFLLHVLELAEGLSHLLACCGRSCASCLCASNRVGFRFLGGDPHSAVGWRQIRPCRSDNGAATVSCCCLFLGGHGAAPRRPFSVSLGLSISQQDGHLFGAG
mmetsp:Transcript_40839/g.115517  ORF Transcript_40839/g.115517 Transcript_40839/m.115517 type:complete len:239 (+) Transcript_40839:1540-2256(+)